MSLVRAEHLPAGEIKLPGRPGLNGKPMGSCIIPNNERMLFVFNKNSGDLDNLKRFLEKSNHYHKFEHPSLNLYSSESLSIKIEGSTLLFEKMEEGEDEKVNLIAPNEQMRKLFFVDDTFQEESTELDSIINLLGPDAIQQGKLFLGNGIRSFNQQDLAEIASLINNHVPAYKESVGAEMTVESLESLKRILIKRGKEDLDPSLKLDFIRLVHPLPTAQERMKLRKANAQNNGLDKT